MSDTLREEQLRWARLLRGEPEEVELTEVAEQDPEGLHGDTVLRVEVAAPISTNTNGSDFGDCTICHKHRRLWSGVCGWCGAEPEDFEE